MISRLLLLLGVAAASISFARADTIDHDKVQPFAQPEPFKLSLQIVTGCHPYPAVNAAGETSGGLKGTGENDEDCTGSTLGSQVYGRAVWYEDLWAIMYAVAYYDILKEGPPKCYYYRWGRQSCEVPFVEHINGTTVMLSYERYFDGTIGDFQILRPTTRKVTGEFQDLIMWEQLTEEACTALSNTDFGEKSPVPFIDANFNKTLDMARPIF
ncbi:necrosis inducing-like protein NPP1 type [Phytophthora sojae]|uniref:Necrosis inducing-like protein NPP1 type n=1 Tax=Phytophthora sojae (strain P6497) TaxID=1094619 RepID=G4Z9A6_PHYSP|nr:necrosis inducing-like protein NPP1 type [Phytophthora sojae]EGZ21907.1 necrosis inducing-like protein NPP1 type [Phytophthora sojae]|eukprot:XP_009524624.1 necrosis inducing-like protein NPP1 type [Phytophthora sojae]